MSQKQITVLGLMLGTLGVVFGDIGTSPLYALKIVLTLSNQTTITVAETVYGLLSMLLWTVIMIVSVKYIGYIMRASNHGEGGITALIALINSSKLRRRSLLVALGLVGVALFYGDSVVTPAISVLSAVEGLRLVAPQLSHLIIPITLLILGLLFSIQKYGTEFVGRLFGPIMFLWFLSIGVGGAWRVWQHPGILQALSPLAAIDFIGSHPLVAFAAMGAIVLAVTGAEALYADMGHFGRKPIARAWFLFVFPALALCYLGQGALIVDDPAALANPFYLLFPSSLQLPMILLATAATLIASQSVISGTFSLTRQAIQLNFLPRMTVKQTSEKYIGQIYLPFINLLMLLFVAALVVFFGSSEGLAGAYGVAVSGTLAVDSILFIATMRYFWHRSKGFVGLYAIVFLTLDLILVTANTPKIIHGGWLPLAIACLVLLVFYIWHNGQRLAAAERRRIEPPLQSFIIEMQSGNHKVTRLPGQAVYIGHHTGLTPTALRMAVEELKELHEQVVIVYVEISSAAHVPPEERVSFDELGYADGICQVIITYGFHDSPNVPKTLEAIRHWSSELDIDPQSAIYFISLSRNIMSRRHTMPTWQKSLYTIMFRNALSSTDYYRLPVENTIEMRTLIKL